MAKNKWWLHGSRGSGKTTRLLCDVYENEIAELKKENARLKLELEALGEQIPWKDIKDKSRALVKLAEAKEMIKRLMHELVVSNRPYDEVELLVKDVEQFLKEVETQEDRLCEFCDYYKSCPDGKRCLTCDNGSKWKRR